MFCNAKYRGGVRWTVGLENTGGGDDRVETPLFLLVIDEIRGIPAGRESKFTIQPVVV